MFKFVIYAPIIFEFLAKLIKDVEALRKDGAEKKKLVLESVAEFLKQLGIYSEKVMSIVSVAIDAYVLFYNLTGLFTHNR